MEVLQQPLVEVRSESFHWSDHPWLSLLLVMVMTVVGAFGNIFLVNLGLDMVTAKTATMLLGCFIVVPFILRLPKGSRSFTAYLQDIRLRSGRPLLLLLGFTLSCYVIKAGSQIIGTIVYRVSLGLPITYTFLQYVMDLSTAVNSGSLYWMLPSMYEEVLFRGIVLTLFMNRYSVRQSIEISALGFGLFHLMNMLNPGATVISVLAQVGYCSVIGLFYGYITIKSDSLLPAMLLHWLGNAFIYTFTRYIELYASVPVQSLYLVVFGLGLIPTGLMILWVRYVTTKWQQGQFPPVIQTALRTRY
jgi:membrane protease YdiL (CAAX protease family)